MKLADACHALSRYTERCLNCHKQGFCGKPREEGVFPCTSCDKVFSTTGLLKMHMGRFHTDRSALRVIKKETTSTEVKRKDRVPQATKAPQVMANIMENTWGKVKKIFRKVEKGQCAEVLRTRDWYNAESSNLWWGGNFKFQKRA